MSHLVRPPMALQCKECDWRPPEDAMMEAVALHFNVEHDTDNYAMDLRAVCSCGAAMTFDERTEPRGPRLVADFFTCPACGNTAEVHREPEADGSE